MSGPKKNNPFDSATFKKGIAYVESNNGKHTWNKTSSATGKYQFLYNEIKHLPEMRGVSREQFNSNPELQERIMDMAINNKLKGRPGYYRNANDLTNDYKEVLGSNWNYRPDEVAALSHFLGRKGARDYFRSVAEGKEYKVAGKNNATVSEYLDRYNRGIGSDRGIVKQQHPLPSINKMPEISERIQGIVIPDNLDFSKMAKPKPKSQSQIIPYSQAVKPKQQQTQSQQQQGSTDYLIDYINNNQFNDGGMLTEFNNGGTHEQNPLGGIPQGIGANGQRNTVEEGETKKDNYIYSDRLELTKEKAARYGLHKKFVGKSYADITKELTTQTKETNNKIDSDTSNEMLERVKMAAEESRMEQEAIQSNQMFLGGDEGEAGKPGVGAYLGAAQGLMNVGQDIFGKSNIETDGSVRPEGVQSVGGSTLGGAMKGAQAGMAFGPLGAGIGGVVGAIGGLFAGKKNKKAEQEGIKNNDLMQNSKYTNDFLFGGSTDPNKKKPMANGALPLSDDMEGSSARNIGTPQGDRETVHSLEGKFDGFNLGKYAGIYDFKKGNVYNGAQQYIAPSHFNPSQLKTVSDNLRKVNPNSNFELIAGERKPSIPQGTMVANDYRNGGKLQDGKKRNSSTKEYNDTSLNYEPYVPVTVRGGEQMVDTTGLSKGNMKNPRSIRGVQQGEVVWNRQEGKWEPTSLGDKKYKSAEPLSSKSQKFLFDEYYPLRRDVEGNRVFGANKDFEANKLQKIKNNIPDERGMNQKVSDNSFVNGGNMYVNSGPLSYLFGQRNPNNSFLGDLNNERGAIPREYTDYKGVTPWDGETAEQQFNFDEPRKGINWDKIGDIANDALRYAPAANNLIQAATLKKPEQEALDRLDNRYKPNYVDERGLINRAQSSYNNVSNALRGTNVGGAGLRSNLLMAHLNKQKGLSDSFMQADNINRQEDRFGQQFNLNVDSRNLGQSNMQKDINARNRAAYDNNKSKMWSAFSQDLGNIGLENMRKKYPEKLDLLYNYRGKYRG